MTQIVVNTKAKLNMAGGLGAGLFTGSPLIGGLLAAGQVNQAGRFGSATFIDNAIAISLIATSLSMLGLILVLIGREYQHEVQILKQDQPQSRDNTPLSGTTESERQTLGVK